MIAILRLWIGKLGAGKLLSYFFPFSKDIEMERLTIKPQCFVIKEKLGNKAQIFTVDSLNSSIQLKYTNVIVSVDFITWRMSR